MVHSHDFVVKSEANFEAAAIFNSSMSAAASAAADTDSAENIWQRLRKRIGKAARSLDLHVTSPILGTATLGRHHRISSSTRQHQKHHTLQRHRTQYYTPQHRHRQHRFYSQGREVQSENDQTDGENEDEDVCSCPNTPLKGGTFIQETEFAFPPSISRGRCHCHCDCDGFVGMKGKQGSVGPVPPPKPPRSHLSQQKQHPGSLQQPFVQQYQVNLPQPQNDFKTTTKHQQRPQQNATVESSKQQQQQHLTKGQRQSTDRNLKPKESHGTFQDYHKAASGSGVVSSGGPVTADPDMVDGYHEFIKDSGHINTFTRKYIGLVTPKTYPQSSSVTSTESALSDTSNGQDGVYTLSREEPFKKTLNNPSTQSTKLSANYNRIKPDSPVQQEVTTPPANRTNAAAKPIDSHTAQPSVATTTPNTRPVKANVGPPQLVALHKRNGDIYQKRGEVNGKRAEGDGNGAKANGITGSNGKESEVKRNVAGSHENPTATEEVSAKPEEKHAGSSQFDARRKSTEVENKRATSSNAFVHPQTASMSKATSSDNNNSPASVAAAVGSTSAGPVVAGKAVAPDVSAAEGNKRDTAFNTANFNQDKRDKTTDSKSKVPPKTKPKPSRNVDAVKLQSATVESNKSAVFKETRAEELDNPVLNVVKRVESEKSGFSPVDSEAKGKTLQVADPDQTKVVTDKDQDTSGVLQDSVRITPDKEKNPEKESNKTGLDQGSKRPGNGSVAAAMSLEIKTTHNNEEDPGYASVEENPLESPGQFHSFYYCLHDVLCICSSFCIRKPWQTNL